MTVPFDHLLALSDDVGTFEHAEYQTRRTEHGYCVDDVARVLVAIYQSPEPRTHDLTMLEERSLRFVISSIADTGQIRNRRRYRGDWCSEAGTGDWWGRALWALGTAAQHATTPALRHFAHEAFTLAATQTSTSPRALAFATMGAAELFVADPHHHGGHAVGEAFVRWYVSTLDPDAWPWPEERLAYSNAIIGNALIAAGHHSGQLIVVHHGLALLDWLFDIQTIDGHLSVIPVGGAGPGDRRPRFDQQPVEVARLADACVRAFSATFDQRWLERLELCARWFDGHNDLGEPMWNPNSGGGFDGLTPNGPNLNQGAESTLAVITTRLHHERLADLRTSDESPNSSNAAKPD